jgi:hypothetical protein
MEEQRGRDAAVPEQREVVKCEWKVCWKWIFPYPCERCRVATQWCYQFSSVKDQCFAFAEKHCGCEQGHEFCWWDGCFGWFTQWRFGVTACFDNLLDDQGTCGSGSIPPGDVPGVARWLGKAQGIDKNGWFSPPLEVRVFCVPCALARIVIAILALTGLWTLLS